MFSFLCGTVVGIYLEQNYDLPNIKNMLEQIKGYLNQYEKQKQEKKS